jgi:DNA-binding response OmpR family regulator
MVKKRILIVDDEAPYTRLLKLSLVQTARYEVEVENNSAGALALAEQFLPDLILLDVMMPGTDGGELASRLKANARLAQVPIVFLTAAVKREELRSRGGIIGGLPFLAKPVELAEIMKCIDGILGTPASKP